MDVGPVCWTLLPTGLSEWELGPWHRERSPIISYLFKDLISKQSHSETLRLGLPHVNCEGTHFISDSPLGMPDTVDTLPITNDRVHIASQQKGYPAPKS